MQAMREYEKDRLSMSHSLGYGGIISDAEELYRTRRNYIGHGGIRTDFA